MDAFIPRYCLSLLLLTSIASSAESNGTIQEELREPRVSGRIVKLYSGVKPEPYFCTGEGFQADPGNCAVFYRCVKEKSGKFTVFRYQCAPGTVYDPDLETCNHPRSTKRSECGGMLKPTVETYYTTNMNEINEAQSEVPRPISTKAPKYTEHTTPENPTTLSWILSSEHQNIPSKAPWGSNMYKTSTVVTNQHRTTQSSSTSGYNWVSSTQHYPKIEITSSPKSTQQSNSKNTEPCTSDGFMGDSENCRKFYRCVGNQRGGYVKYEFSCSELTVWDDEIQGCNHPWAVKRSKCGRSLSYEHKTTLQNPGVDSTESFAIKEPVTNYGGYGYKQNKTIQQQLQISHGSKVTQTQTQISNSQEVIQNQTQINYGNKAVQIKNPESKQNQTQRNYGSAVSQTQTQIDYGNKGVQTQLQIDHSKDSSQSQVQIQESTTNKPTSSSTQNSNMGNNDCFESGFMGDANDCKKFYRCVDNGLGRYTKFEYFCGDGTVWDPEIEACNHAWAVKNCGGRLPTAPSTEGHITTTKLSEYNTDSTKTTQSQLTTSQVPDEENEDDVGYGHLNNQETTPYFTTTLKTTTTTTTTEKSDGATTECTSSGFIGDRNNCKIFYRCVDNGNGSFTKYEFKCGDGTLWDSDIEACNHAWAVKNCGVSSSGNIDKEESTTKQEITKLPDTTQTTVTLVQITTQPPTQIGDYDTGYGSQNHEHQTTTTIRTTKLPQREQNDTNSECKFSGFMGDENDCKKFYRCVDNGNGGYIRYEFTCGEGTVWDPKIEACNHAWAVGKCGGSSSVIQNTETPSQPTISSDTSSIYTTQVTKETQRPVSIITTTTTSASTTTSYDVNNECSKSGFIGDSSNCKKFYRCVDNGDGSFTRYEFTCGEGTVWDSKIEACNHAWAVEKCGGSSESTHAIQQTTSEQPAMHDEEQENGYVTPSYEASEIPQITSSTSLASTTSTTLSGTIQCNKSGFMGDKNDCKKFYRCVDNGKGGYDQYEFQCGKGTVWDGSIEACNHAWAVKDCGESISGTTHFQYESTTQSISSSIASEDGQTQQYTEKTTTTTVAYHESEVTAGDKCIQEGFFSNKMDCKKFYRCVYNGSGGFTKYEFSCGEGTSWNQEIQGCDHVSPDRPCGSSSQVTSPEPIYLNDDMDIKSTSTTKATTTTKEIDNEGTTKQPQISQGTCQSEGFYANPSDCKKFYRCVSNGNSEYTKYDFNCGDGTVWNQEIQACDHESADKKCSAPSTSQNNATEFHSESTTSFYSTTRKQETTDKPESAEATGSECTSEGFFAHPTDCKKFIRCVNNHNGGFTRYEFSCGDGTVWVQEIQACDHDNDVTSCSSQSGSTTTPKPPNIEGHSSSTTASSTVFSTESLPPNREDDEYDTENSKEPSHDETDECTSEGYFANTQDCRKFYRCVDNGNGGFTKYDFVCGDGTAWDSNLQTCNHINEVKSCSGSTQEGSGNHQSTTNKNQGETESSSSTTKATTSSSQSSGDSNSNGQDTCESEGYFGNSKDCKKFYRCVDNGKGGYTKYDFTCGDGTIWDQDITGCNHPQDVSNPSCGSNQGTSDFSTTSSSTTNSSSQTTSTTTESTSSSSQSTSDGQESSKKPVNNNVKCDKAGYYANPNDCKKFYRCVDWDGDGKRFSVFHFECGEGTIWDPALDTCNYEDSVYPQRDCSQTQSQNVGGETTVTDGTKTTTESNTNGPTTEELTTSEQNTAQQSTNEPTTTQQLTTNEQTTTQQPTSSEKTTTEELTTNKQTTAQQPTTTTQESTSESTTTQQSTTDELTTSQQSTTSEQTTTQKSTTSEQTTTQQSTTSEQTTTQQSTSEQTTTEKSTTSGQTTTQQPTTSDLTTTEQSTTSEQTTTQQSTTSEQTTTQQSTSEQTTTQQLTSEQTTTQQSSTTDQTTTQESSTNEQTTTEQSTTSEQTTTQQSSTTEQTTEESSATEQTTEGTSTTEETTDQSTTQTSSTESDSTEEQSTTEPYSTTVASSSPEKECPETEDDQYLLVCPTSFKRHPKYCNIFYQCTEDDDTYEAKMAMFKCPNNTIYDESQTQCVSEDKTDKKCDGEIANKRRFKRLGFNYKDPIVADKGKQSCSTVGYFSFEKHSECAKGFLKCERSKNGQLRGYVYQCPDGYIYWSISKRCERTESVPDCKRSSNDWTGRWNIPVERKNVAAS